MLDPQLDAILRLFDLAPSGRDLSVEDPHERDLNKLYRLYSAVLDSMPAIIFVKSADLRFLLCNKKWSSVTRIRREDAIGKTVFDIYPPELASILDAADRKILAEKTPASIDNIFPSATGEPKILRATKVPILDDSGEIRLIVGVSQDITEQKSAEEALEKSHTELTVTRDNLMKTIRELSTPVLPIHDGVLVVPLVGHLDSQRSAQFTDTLLLGIQRHRAETVIIDITGVELVDTAVANHLLQATRAAALLGTECVLVGIAPAIARTFMQIGVDFGALTTRRDLQAGVTYALAKRPSAD